jgi:hypothetical protein
VETAVSTGNLQQLKMVPRRNRGNWRQRRLPSNGFAILQHVRAVQTGWLFPALSMSNQQAADPSTINSNLFMPPPAAVHFTAIGVFGMKQRFLRPGRIPHVI